MLSDAMGWAQSLCPDPWPRLNTRNLGRALVREMESQWSKPRLGPEEAPHEVQLQFRYSLVSGKASDIRIKESSGIRQCDEAAVQAARNVLRTDHGRLYTPPCQEVVLTYRLPCESPP